jgi:long-chain fatty acid transport protein
MQRFVRFAALQTLARMAVTIAVVGIFSGPAAAGGLWLYEVGTADVGLASAGYGARAQDAATVLTNPAGMTRLEGSLFTLGAQVLYADLVFLPSSETSPGLGTNDGGNPIGWFPGGGAFYSYSVSPELKVGAAVTGNFGLALEYDSEWVGRYYVQEGTLIGISILPSIAYRVNEQLSFGASLNAMYGKLKQRVAINIPGALDAPDAQLGLDSDTWGWGFNLGAMWELNPASRLGLTYNSLVELDLKSPAAFTGLPADLEARLRFLGLLDGTVGIEVTVPQQVMLSGFHQVSKRYALLWSIGWQQWSEFGRPDVALFQEAGDTLLTADLDYKDTWHYALGGQYRMSDPWLLNLGVAYDTGFQTEGEISPMLPMNSQWRFGVGVQNDVSETFGWGLAAEYMYAGTLDVDNRSSVGVALGGRGDLVGSYENVGVFLFAPSLNWRF